MKKDGQVSNSPLHARSVPMRSLTSSAGTGHSAVYLLRVLRRVSIKLRGCEPDEWGRSPQPLSQHRWLRLDGHSADAVSLLSRNAGGYSALREADSTSKSASAVRTCGSSLLPSLCNSYWITRLEGCAPANRASQIMILKTIGSYCSNLHPGRWRQASLFVQRKRIPALKLNAASHPKLPPQSSRRGRPAAQTYLDSSSPNR
jgi:hypothetical protein